jgi:hypothetical protein
MLLKPRERLWCPCLEDAHCHCGRQLDESCYAGCDNCWSCRWNRLVHIGMKERVLNFLNEMRRFSRYYLAIFAIYLIAISGLSLGAVILEENVNKPGLIAYTIFCVGLACICWRWARQP